MDFGWLNSVGGDVDKLKLVINRSVYFFVTLLPPPPPLSSQFANSWFLEEM